MIDRSFSLPYKQRFWYILNVEKKFVQRFSNLSDSETKLHSRLEALVETSPQKSRNRNSLDIKH